MSSSSKTSFSTFTSYAATPKSATTPETSNIRVVVRIRPKTDYEISRENSPSTPNSRVSQLHAPHEDEPVAISPLGDGKSLQLLDISRKGSDEGTKRVLTFHRVYEETTDQERVFEECGVKDLVSQAINGYAATIFAFGQTGSGKTFTITGPEHHWSLHPERLGIIPRALEHLFSETTANHPADTFIIRATYLEIYNELVQDLLSPLASPTSSLPVRWTAERGFYVENAITVECRDLDDCIAVLEEGLKNRSTGAHRLNEYSSRSHSIMTVYIESGEGESMKRGKISFVDLAGSERVRESRAKGDTLTETMSINKSLLTLGNCISALADPKKRNGHIPYRDSNLTKLLSDSLGGSGLALMIACISPSSVNLQESLKHCDMQPEPEKSATDLLFKLDQSVIKFSLFVGKSMVSAEKTLP
ncbi:kinesin-domain-containing protein [Rhizoclosmatium globosum]|uniref:Kinesin-like protein n=1 Tax=Rhizoclosmatium globosum TaxID=329046 RepID=A0A1Y2CPH5_9FUNG|nr:kinesin-domain-containing protein [Rhizoclosmatium globosum]|eukprot:ORY48867.1 kinesin-domain-containing protein [Rhizoclosmatium globosum]